MADTVLLYRAMCEAEFSSLAATGDFSIVPGSLEVKWFAERPEHAAAWGRAFERLTGVPHERIVAIELDADVADRLLRLPRLDGIGPARAAELSDLSGVRWAEYPQTGDDTGSRP